MPTLASMVASVEISNLPACVYNLQHCVIETFSGLLTTNSHRLITIVGGYLLLRPYLFRLISKNQVLQLHRYPQDAPVPNGLHDACSKRSEDEDESEEAGWGYRARRSQRHAATKSVEA
ncbi:hypothetical protein BDR22DRAFT_885729 [Usnea florida]